MTGIPEMVGNPAGTAPSPDASPDPAFVDPTAADPPLLPMPPDLAHPK